MSASAEVVRAAPRSWIDVVLEGIAGLGWPKLVAFLVLFGVGELISHVDRWASGVLPVGETSPALLLEAVFPIMFLVALDALNGVARRALEHLRPALRDEADVDAIRRELVRTPALPAAVGAVIGAAVGIASIVSNPASYGITPSTPLLAWATAAGASIATMVIAAAFLVHVVHQLRIVARVHDRLVVVNLFNLTPLYAFANLTALTGLTLIGIVVFGLLSLPYLEATGSSLSAVDIGTVLALVLVGVGAFVLPLLGLHDRIAEEKDRRRATAAATIERVIAELDTEVGAGQFDRMIAMQNAVTAATSALTTIQRIPTWPWRQETLRAFVSALGLPVVIWLITEWLGRVVT